LATDLTGITPLHGFHAAAPITCDAFNAQVVAGREYLTFLYVIALQAAKLAFRRSDCRSLLWRSWRTRRMARYRLNVSDLLYTATALSSVLSLSRCDFSEALGYAESQYFGYQFCLQPMPHLFIYKKMRVAKLVKELSCCQYGNVSLIVFEDGSDSLYIAFSRPYNNGVREQLSPAFHV